MNQKLSTFTIIVLGSLTAFGPFITDFYLPCLPDMQNYFCTSESLIAMSLTCGMLGLAAGQLLIGPLSDKFGRKNLLVASMVLFAVSCLLCLFTTNILIFNILRILQGLGGAGGVVLSKSMATDTCTGKQLANVMAVLGAINGVAPVFAPVLGGAMSNIASWQGVFSLLLAIGIILIYCTLRLKETLLPEQRADANLLHAYAKLFKVFKNKRFTLSTLSMLTMAFGFFAYIAASPFILQNQYGLSPFMFSLCFALNAVMIAVGTFVSTKFKKQGNAIISSTISFFVSAIFVAIFQIFKVPLILLMLSYIALLFSFGILQPVATAVALDSERENAGAASAIFGAGIFVGGIFSSPLIGIGNILISTSIVILAGAILCLLLSIPLSKMYK